MTEDIDTPDVDPMVDFFAHTERGEILCAGRCPASAVAIQQPFPGAIVRVGQVQLGSCYFDIDLQAVMDLPPQPSPVHVFNLTTKAWEDPRTLEDLKARKRAQINAARLKANQTHFTFQGKQIACDPLSRSDIDGVSNFVAIAGALPPGFPGVWKTVDNSYVPIPDVTAWLQFIGAMVQQGTANFGKSEGLKAQLDAATTPEQVEALRW